MTEPTAVSGITVGAVAAAERAVDEVGVELLGRDDVDDGGASAVGDVGVGGRGGARASADGEPTAAVAVGAGVAGPGRRCRPGVAPASGRR